MLINKIKELLESLTCKKFEIFSILKIKCRKLKSICISYLPASRFFKSRKHTENKDIFNELQNNHWINNDGIAGIMASMLDII